jgi:hypothetical protein
MLAAVPAGAPAGVALRSSQPRTGAGRARRAAQPLRSAARAPRPAAAGCRLRLAPRAAAGRVAAAFGASAAVAEQTLDVPLNYYKARPTQI